MVDLETLWIGIQTRYIIKCKFSLYQCKMAIPKVQEGSKQGHEPDEVQLCVLIAELQA